MTIGPDRMLRYVQRHYDRDPQREWERMDRHPTEFAVTLRALEQYLPPTPARVLDCGGGPGRYAIQLARWGYDVTLFDLSPASLRLAQTKAAEAGASLTAYEQGTATDLSRFPDESFDAVLLMGPLYHLLALLRGASQRRGDACALSSTLYILRRAGKLAMQGAPLTRRRYTPSSMRRSTPRRSRSMLVRCR